MFPVQQGGVGKNRNQQPFLFQVKKDIGEIFSKKRLTPGEQTPQGTQRDGLIDDFFDSIKAEFLFDCFFVCGGQVDIAVPAVVIATGRNFKIKGQGDAFAGRFSP